mmetsp:Transcript_5755/g.9086  ORF Transcript_5755/g.9086 Transcript_5755/m.9086 type:complete len:124 (-) Transcript_5755:231-602(-)
MTTTTEYKLLDTYDTLLDAKPLYPQATAESKNYPGARRQVLDGKPPSGSILVKTGGNALQAIDRETEYHKLCRVSGKKPRRHRSCTVSLQRSVDIGDDTKRSSPWPSDSCQVPAHGIYERFEL